MYDHDPIKDLGLSCPYNGQFFICENDPVRFIGCCSINPCGTRKGLCPDEHLKPASFEKEHGHEILPQACVNDNVDVAWYTCSGTAPAFMGCCAVNPCSQGGCPKRELRAAKLSDKTKNAEVFLSGSSDYAPGTDPSVPDPVADPVSSLGVISTVASSTITSGFLTSFTTEPTLETTTSFLATSTPNPESGGPGGDGKPPNGGKIAGATVPTIIIFIVLLVLFVYGRGRGWFTMGWFKMWFKHWFRRWIHQDRFALSVSSVHLGRNTAEKRRSKTQKTEANSSQSSQHDSPVQGTQPVENEASQSSHGDHSAQQAQTQRAELDASQPANDGHTTHERPRARQNQQVQQHELSAADDSNIEQSIYRYPAAPIGSSLLTNHITGTNQNMDQQSDRDNLPSQDSRYGRYTRTQPNHLPGEPGRLSPAPSDIVPPKMPTIQEDTGTPTSYVWPEEQRNLRVRNGPVERWSGSSEGSSRIAKSRRDKVGSGSTWDSVLSDPLKKPRVPCGCSDKKCNHEWSKETDEE
ncbi:hypothetical protein FSARC_3989 [Fusarium sarcochroum]|uniref:Uncharacterized protein n=1 Tax=Fusarium sarcochroum TaxID=1208366 RepID=A0A8H4U372_9HYPO|nr:hypothetical protein FSARC_3989 [Fusarium sarcochroum]